MEDNNIIIAAVGNSNEFGINAAGGGISINLCPHNTTDIIMSMKRADA